MEKNWIVVELDSYESSNVFSGAYGPFTEQEAIDFACKLNDKDIYATRFVPHRLSLKCWAE